MCITTECRIDNAAGTAQETANELQKAMTTATAVEAIAIRDLLVESVTLQNKLRALYSAMQAQG